MLSRILIALVLALSIPTAPLQAMDQPSSDDWKDTSTSAEDRQAARDTRADLRGYYGNSIKIVEMPDGRFLPISSKFKLTEHYGNLGCAISQPNLIFHVPPISCTRLIKQSGNKGRSPIAAGGKFYVLQKIKSGSNEPRGKAKFRDASHFIRVDEEDGAKFLISLRQSGKERRDLYIGEFELNAAILTQADSYLENKFMQLQKAEKTEAQNDLAAARKGFSGGAPLDMSPAEYKEYKSQKVEVLKSAEKRMKKFKNKIKDPKKTDYNALFEGAKKYKSENIRRHSERREKRRQKSGAVKIDTKAAEKAKASFRAAEKRTAEQRRRLNQPRRIRRPGQKKK